MTTPDDEWVEYEVLGKKIRMKKADLDAKVAAMQKEPGSFPEKIMRHFGDSKAVKEEPGEDHDPTKREMLKDKL